MSQAFASALAEVASQRQLTIVGDIHSNLTALKTMSAPENFEALRDAGVRHLFVEVPNEFQRDYDRFLAGKLTDKQLVSRIERKVTHQHLSGEDVKEFWKEHLGMVREANANGIRVWAADMRKNLEKDYGAEYQEKGSLAYDSVAAYVHDKHRQRMPDGSTVSPINDDRPLARFIQEKAGNEKAVFYGGMEHGRRSYDVDELFGEDRAARVEIYSGKMRQVWEDLSTWLGRHAGEKTDPDPPAFIYYADDDQVKWLAKPQGPDARIDVGPLGRSIDEKAAGPVKPALQTGKPLPPKPQHKAGG